MTPAKASPAIVMSLVVVPAADLAVADAVVEEPVAVEERVAVDEPVAVPVDVEDPEAVEEPVAVPEEEAELAIKEKAISHVNSLISICSKHLRHR